jgi:hypothetical protein
MRIKRTNEMRYKELRERVLPEILPDLGPVVLLKGSALALTLYEDISLRSMCDFDILVKTRKTANDIFMKLQKFGYQMTHDNDPLNNSSFHDKDLAVEISCPDRFMIEFHWNPVNYHLSYVNNINEWFFSQSKSLIDTIVLSNMSGVGILSPSADFVLQVIHCYLEHGLPSMSLLNVYETFFMMRKWRHLIDWGKVCEIFSVSGWLPCLKFVSEATDERFGMPLPIDNLKNLGDSFSSKIFNSQIYSSKTHAALYLFNMKPLPFGKKVKVFFEAVFPSPLYMRDRYRGSNLNLASLYFKRLKDALTDTIKLLSQ